MRCRLPTASSTTDESACLDHPNPTLDIERHSSDSWSCSAKFLGMFFCATPSFAWLAFVSPSVFGNGHCNLNSSDMHKDASRLQDLFTQYPGRPVPQPR